MKMFKRCMAVLLALCLCPTSNEIASAASKTVTVATQAQLNKAVKDGNATTIKISTNKAVKLTIPAGSKTKNMKLSVNAPKATITNQAQFKSITLGGDNVNWLENGKNNVITVSAKMAGLKVTKKTTVKKITFKGPKANIRVHTGSKVDSVVAAKKGATLNIRVNGTVGKLEALSADAKLNLRGLTEKFPVTVKAEGITLTITSAVDALLEKNATVILAKGSEEAIITVVDGADAEVVNKTEQDAVVVTPDGEVIVEAGKEDESVIAPEPTPEPEPSPEPTTPPSGGGGNGGPVNPPTTVAVTGVTLNKTAAALKVNETVQLTATVAPANATNKNVKWTVSGSAVTVDTKGLVTAKEAGEATVTVTTADGGKTAECVVTVSPADEGTDEPDPAPTEFNYTIKYFFDAVEDNAKEETGTGEENSTITATNYADTTYELDTAKTASLSFTLTEDNQVFNVYFKTKETTDTDVPVTDVTLLPETLTLTVDDSAQTLTATVAPTDATNPVFAWTTSVEGIVNVVPAEDGKTATVTPVAAGIATITVTVTDVKGTAYTDTCNVEVKAAEVVDPTPTPIPVDGNVMFAFPYNAIESTSTGLSADPNYEVSEWGLTAGTFSGGTVAISGEVTRAKLTEKTYGATFPVYVKLPGVVLNDVAEITIAVGEGTPFWGYTTADAAYYKGWITDNETDTYLKFGHSFAKDNNGTLTVEQNKTNVITVAMNDGTVKTMSFTIALDDVSIEEEKPAPVEPETITAEGNVMFAFPDGIDSTEAGLSADPNFELSAWGLTEAAFAISGDVTKTTLTDKARGEFPIYVKLPNLKLNEIASIYISANEGAPFWGYTTADAAYYKGWITDDETNTYLKFGHSFAKNGTGDWVKEPAKTNVITVTTNNGIVKKMSFTITLDGVNIQ